MCIEFLRVGSHDGMLVRRFASLLAAKMVPFLEEHKYAIQYSCEQPFTLLIIPRIERN